MRDVVGLVAELEVGRERVGADLGPLGLPAPRAHRGVGDEVDLHLGLRRDDGADVAALDHDVALGAELALALAHHLAHLRVARDDRHHPVDPHLADRVGDVGVVDVARGRRSSKTTGFSRASAPSAGPSPRSSAAAEREPGQAAVHRAGVEVAEAEPLGERSRATVLLPAPAGPSIATITPASREG